MTVRGNLKRKEERVIVGEFWTSKQRQAHNIHYAVSYRASFKPELPSYFINEFLTGKKKVVLDPFGGRGTTSIQANLEGHYAVHNDISPLAVFLGKSRKVIPDVATIEKKLHSLNLSKKTQESEMDNDLLAFFHKDTLNEIKNLKKLSLEDESPEMQYIRLTALSRLHGHSPGFFSVYTFPQLSIPASAQRKNNITRGQKPEYRELKPRIIKKMRNDLSMPLPPFYHEFSKHNLYLNNDSRKLEGLDNSVVDLAVTSPPFLDKVDYAMDNWMRTWFLNFTDMHQEGISMFHSVDVWEDFIHNTLKECSRVMKKNAHLVMEVGEVKSGKKVIYLDEVVIQAAENSGLIWEKTYINSQKFTKLSNCWNVKNNELGTNSNRCVVFRNIK